MDNSGRSDHFPEGTECPPWFFLMSAGTKLQYAFKLSYLNSRKIYLKKKKLKGFIYRKGNFALVTTATVTTVTITTVTI